MPNDSTPEIINVNSEALEATIRNLLPSQRGFGSELQASNVITPIIDLTATAEGSVLLTNLQTALAFGSQTYFQAVNASVTIANSAGFYRVTGASTGTTDGSASTKNTLVINDGASDKIIWQMSTFPVSAAQAFFLNVDYTVFLRAGDTLKAVSDDNSMYFAGSIRQIATVTGELVVPNGFVAE